MKETCPRCGGAARLLFNLLACNTLKCRNYEENWAKEWSSNFGPLFTHSPMPGWTDHVFLSRYVTSTGSKFDLYACKIIYGADYCLARFGNNGDQVYYVDAHESEIGIPGAGPVSSVSPSIKEALKQALTIFKKRRKFLAP